MSSPLNAEQTGATYAPLLLRVTLGALFIAHLYWKFAVLPGGFNQWWSNFALNGYPGFVPWYVLSAPRTSGQFARDSGLLLAAPNYRSCGVSCWSFRRCLVPARMR